MLDDDKTETRAAEETEERAAEETEIRAAKETEENPSPTLNPDDFDFTKIADFIYEGLFLKRTPRTGYKFLGRGEESVAEHSFGATFIAFNLGRMSLLAGEKIDLDKLLKMILFHDLAESRTGDLNYMNKRYLINKENLAAWHAFERLPYRIEMLDLFEEWQKNKTPEARLAHDADQLDMIVELSRLVADGSEQAKEWIVYAKKRLSTRMGKSFCEAILNRHPDSWWFVKKDELWVNPKGPEDPGNRGE
jgi:putative hydrolase of HD superfamily